MKLRTFLSFASLFLFILMMFFTLKDTKKVLDILNQSNKIIIFVSSLFFVFFNIYSSIIFHSGYNMFGIKMNFKRVFYMSYIAILGRYIPGRLWFLAIILAISKTLNLDLKKVSLTNITLQFFLFYTSIPYFIFLFYLLKKHFIMLIFVILFFTLPIVLHIISRKLNFILHFRNFLVIFLLFVPYWPLSGLSFYFFIYSLGFNINLFYSLTIFPIAYNMGIISFISPGGLGVREGVITLMLMKFFDIQTSNNLSILFRIFTILIESLLTLVAYILYISDRSKK